MMLSIPTAITNYADLHKVAVVPHGDGVLVVLAEVVVTCIRKMILDMLLKVAMHHIDSLAGNAAHSLEPLKTAFSSLYQDHDKLQLAAL